MEKQFRVQTRLRWFVNLVAIVFTPYSLLNIYRCFVHSPIMMPIEDLFIFITCNFFLVSCSIYLSKLKYVINDEELVIRQIFGRSNRYKLSKIRKIKEISDFIFCTKIYFREKAMPVYCYVDKRDGFVKILRRKSTKSKL